MFQELPSEVQEVLKAAVRKIGDLIADTNIELEKLGFQNYGTVAGSLFYNDPAQWCDIPCLSIISLPAADDPYGEPSYVEAREQAIVAIYSPVTRDAEFVTLSSADLVMAKCNAQNKGKPCKSYGGIVFTCKEIELSGKTSAYRCRPST